MWYCGRVGNNTNSESQGENQQNKNKHGLQFPYRISKYNGFT